MYELKQGSARLISALYARMDDAVALQRLASALDYVSAEQLREDIQALSDYRDANSANDDNDD